MFENFVLCKVVRDGFHSQEIEEHIKALSDKTCQPFKSSTYFIHNNQIFVICFTDESQDGFSIQPAKYRIVL